jgi:hypothetical protein
MHDGMRWSNVPVRQRRVRTGFPVSTSSAFSSAQDNTSWAFTRRRHVSRQNRVRCKTPSGHHGGAGGSQVTFGGPGSHGGNGGNGGIIGNGGAGGSTIGVGPTSSGGNGGNAQFVGNGGNGGNVGSGGTVGQGGTRGILFGQPGQAGT